MTQSIRDIHVHILQVTKIGHSLQLDNNNYNCQSIHDIGIVVKLSHATKNSAFKNHPKTFYITKSRLTVVSHAAKKLQSTHPYKRRVATTVSYLHVGSVLQY